MRTATQNLSPIHATVPNRSLVIRFRDLMEGAFSHLSRKPASLYDERQGKAVPFPVRHIDDYRKKLAEGAKPEALRDIHELVGLEAESLVVDDPSSIGGRLHLTLEEAHEAEVAAECEANLAQLVAVRSQHTADLERALTVTLREITTLKQYARAVKRQIDARKALDQFTRPAS